MRCDNCIYWLKTERESNGAALGFCKRFPPSTVAMPVQTLAGPTIQAQQFLPLMPANDYCGEFGGDMEAKPRIVQ